MVHVLYGLTVLHASSSEWKYYKIANYVIFELIACVVLILYLAELSTVQGRTVADCRLKEISQWSLKRTQSLLDSWVSGKVSIVWIFEQS